ncbi:unnamed protein product [Musa banksii]
MSAAFGNDDGDDAAVAVGTDLSAATSSASPPSPPGFSVGVAPGGGSIPASSDGYGFSSAMTEILHPDPDQMQREKGFILREWRRRGTFLVDPIIRRFGIALPLPLVGFEWPPGAMVRPPKAHAHDGHGGGGLRHRLGSINRRSDP